MGWRREGCLASRVIAHPAFRILAEGSLSLFLTWEIVKEEWGQHEGHQFWRVGDSSRSD